MKFTEDAATIALVAWFSLISVFSLALAYLDWHSTLWPLRAAVILGIGVFAVGVINTPRSLVLISPLALLGMLVSVAYSALPAMFFPFLNDDLRQSRFATFIDEPPELLVLGFSAACLAIAAGQAPSFNRAFRDRPSHKSLHMPLLVLALIVLCVGLAFLHAVVRKFPDQFASFENHFMRDLLDAAAPLSALLSALSAVAATHEKRPRFFLFFVFAICLEAFALGQESNIKIVAFSFTVGVIFMGLNLPWKQTVFTLCLPAALAVVIGTGVANSAKSYLHADWLRPDVISNAIYYKFVDRQLDTGACFAKVMNTNTGDHSFGDVLGLFIGPIPRVVWPAKPNLSVGQEYAWQYCSMPRETAESTHHSASVTLLGDPIIVAGWPGLIVAEVVLFAVLAMITRITLRTGRTGVMGLLALSPWILDFDQHFPLYIAQVTKCFLYMLPFLVLMRLPERAQPIFRQ